MAPHACLIGYFLLHRSFVVHGLRLQRRVVGPTGLRPSLVLWPILFSVVSEGVDGFPVVVLADRACHFPDTDVPGGCFGRSRRR
jgi:hypothetical protein